MRVCKFSFHNFLIFPCSSLIGFHFASVGLPTFLSCRVVSLFARRVFACTCVEQLVASYFSVF